jgi:hypothetical protein
MRNGQQIYNFCLARERLQQRDRGPAETPAARLARIDQQPAGFVLLDTRFVRVPEDGNIEVSVETAQLAPHVRENNSRAVFERQPRGWLE